MLDQDSDVYKLGKSIFYPSLSFNPGYPTEAIHQDGSSASTVDPAMNHYGTVYNTIENDEIVHNLQKDFSHLEMRGTLENSHVLDEESTVIVEYEPDWGCPSMMFQYSGHNYDNRHCNNPWCSNSSSPYGGTEFSYSQKPNDEFQFSESSYSLDQLLRIPHVPRINGDIPSTDEASSDYERLSQRLQLYDLVEHKVDGDGNCQFRALSDQLHQTPDHHESVRQEIVNQLRANSKFYEGYVPMEYDEYLSKMSRNGEWGDHVTLQAAADVYGVKILVITSFKDTCYIEIVPGNQEANKVILLSFWAEVHYNSIRPQGDIPFANSTKKKRWWSL
ncbi:hypothetical protein SAY87_007453 [Trapa incisa]|uniref:ubiquitinyl hydrolase 1 n=1 Tax=Trapa incisa TaxID=236973 RepID=A0AAN7QF01_9MYRT|nr:hypothetical protein SAY87_007453 [Trapa incisa]